MDNILELNGLNNCFVYVDADYIFAIAEMDEEYVMDDNERIKIPAHTRIFTTNAQFRVQDRAYEIVDKIKQINKNRDL